MCYFTIIYIIAVLMKIVKIMTKKLSSEKFEQISSERCLKKFELFITGENISSVFSSFPMSRKEILETLEVYFDYFSTRFDLIDVAISSSFFSMFNKNLLYQSYKSHLRTPKYPGHSIKEAIYIANLHLNNSSFYCYFWAVPCK